MLNLDASYPFYRKKNFSPPTGGLNTRFNPITLEDSEAVQLENYQVNNTGVLEKYPGFILDGSPFPNSSLSFIRLLYNFRRGATVNSLIVAADDETNNTNTTYSVDLKTTIGDGNYSYLTFGIGTATFTASNTSVTGQNTSWTKELRAGDKIKLASDTDAKYTEIASVNGDTSLTLVVGGYLGNSGTTAAYLARKIWNKNNKLVAISYNNICAFSDGDRPPQQYDGTNLIGLINSYSGTTITVQANAAPKVKYYDVHKNRLFGADDINLYWSHSEDQTFWDPASLEPIQPEDGGVIVGIKAFADSVFVFKNNGYVYRVFGNFDDSAIGTAAYINRVDYSEKIGLIASKSICVHGNYLYFVAQTGVYRVDQRGVMQKVTYNIDPTVNNFLFSGGNTVPKNYAFSNTAQWTSSATLAGCYSNGANQNLQSFFDDYRQTDAAQTQNCCSIALGTDGTIHVAYVPNSDATQLNYVRYRVNGSSLGGTQTRKETSILSASTGNTVNCVSISVSPIDQTVGIAFGDSLNMQYVERTPDTQSPFAYGTWGGQAHIGTSLAIANINFIFSGGGVPYAAINQYNSGNGHYQTGFATRTAGIWTFSNVDTQGSNGTPSQMRCAITLDNSNNIYVSSFTRNSSFLRVAKSTNGGATWSNVEDFTPGNAADTKSSLSIGFNHAGNFLSVFSDTSGNLIKRNHTTTTSTTINTTANSYVSGWFPVYNSLDNINVDTDNYLQILNAGTTPQEQVVSNYNLSSSIGTTVANPTTNVVKTTVRPGTTPTIVLGTTPGQTVAFINYGQNANEIVIRRCCFYGYWQGPQSSDATLSSWGTYVVTGASSGASYQYEIALSSSNPATSFNAITNGAIISSNASLVFNIPRIIFTLSGWGGISVTSLVLNYFGTGVSPIDIFGLSYYNELLFTAANNGQTADSFCLVLDIKNAFLTVDYPMSCIESFNTFLYGGSSANGNIYKLKQGNLFNGSSYTSTFISKEDFLSSIEEQKDFDRIYILYETQPSGTFTFSYRLDNYGTNGGTAWKTVTIDQTQAGPYTLLIGQNARSIQYMVQDSISNNYSALLGWTLYYRPIEAR